MDYQSSRQQKTKRIRDGRVSKDDANQLDGTQNQQLYNPYKLFKKHSTIRSKQTFFQ